MFLCDFKYNRLQICEQKIDYSKNGVGITGYPYGEREKIRSLLLSKQLKRNKFMLDK